MPLAAIPTQLIAGPLGAGKTTLIRHLLEQRPIGERWAVLVNEYGQIGLDAALLADRAEGVSIAEVAGGCLCCVQGVPLRVGLARLLRKARPNRLFIEPSGLGHPLDLHRQLQEAPWTGVLTLQPLVMVLDARQWGQGEVLPEAQERALSAAGLLVLNKSGGLDRVTRERVQANLPSRPLLWTDEGRIALADLPKDSASAIVPIAELPAPGAMGPATLLLPGQPLRFERQDGDGHTLGWQWHSQTRFSRERGQAWLESLPGLRRAKGCLHTAEGWLACNGVGAEYRWQSSAWRRDSRIELIFKHAVVVKEVERDLIATIETN